MISGCGTAEVTPVCCDLLSSTNVEDSLRAAGPGLASVEFAKTAGGTVSLTPTGGGGFGSDDPPAANSSMLDARCIHGSSQISSSDFRLRGSSQAILSTGRDSCIEEHAITNSIPLCKCKQWSMVCFHMYAFAITSLCIVSSALFVMLLCEKYLHIRV